MIAWLLAALFVAEPPLKGRPDNYIGAVGAFEMVAVVLPTRFRLDETATLVVTLEGSGDLSNIRPPDLTKSRSFADRFDIVAPPKRTIEQRKIRFEYQVRARSAAVKAVPKLEAYVYDDAPPRPHYRLLRTAEINVEVLPPSERQVVIASPAAISEAKQSSWRRYALGVVVAGVMLMAIGLFFRVRWPQTKPHASPDAEPNATQMDGRRMKSPPPPAAFLREGPDQWFDRYGEALSLPPGRRTTAEIVAATAKLSIDARSVELLRQNLVVLDAQRFGRRHEAANTADLQVALDDIVERRLNVTEGLTSTAAPPQGTGSPSSVDS